MSLITKSDVFSYLKSRGLKGCYISHSFATDIPVSFVVFKIKKRVVADVVTSSIHYNHTVSIVLYYSYNDEGLHKTKLTCHIPVDPTLHYERLFGEYANVTRMHNYNTDTVNVFYSRLHDVIIKWKNKI